jgi:hypothetical protein
MESENQKIPFINLFRTCFDGYQRLKAGKSNAPFSVRDKDNRKYEFSHNEFDGVFLVNWKLLGYSDTNRPRNLSFEQFYTLLNYIGHFESQHYTEYESANRTRSKVKSERDLADENSKLKQFVCNTVLIITQPQNVTSKITESIMTEFETLGPKMWD